MDIVFVIFLPPIIYLQQVSGWFFLHFLCIVRVHLDLYMNSLGGRNHGLSFLILEHECKYYHWLNRKLCEIISAALLNCLVEFLLSTIWCLFYTFLVCSQTWCSFILQEYFPNFFHDWGLGTFTEKCRIVGGLGDSHERKCELCERSVVMKRVMCEPHVKSSKAVTLKRHPSSHARVNIEECHDATKENGASSNTI